MTTTRVTVEEQSRERFVRETAKHEMTVLKDDGLYRHLRFKQPGSSFYWYDIITWPGRLVICGDVGDYMFSRLEDMFEFFGNYQYGINAYYWGEKLRGPEHGRNSARNYSEDVFRAHVLEWYEQQAEDLEPDVAAGLRAALEEDVLDDSDGMLFSEDEARRRVHEFDYLGHSFVDVWEWDLREWDWSYLWCCWAIVDGIAKYRAATASGDNHER